MIKVKDGYAKLIGTTYAGTADRVLLSNGSDFGLHTGRNNEANKIVRTDASGYILAGWINTTSGNMGTTAITRIYCSNDNYIRYKTPANFFSTLANDSNLLSITVGSLNRKLTIAYATTSSQLNNKSVSDPASAASGLYVKWYSHISQSSGYAGNNYGFPVSNNANGILWLGTHTGPYGWQMGFSSNGHLYARYINNNTFPTTANGGSWNRIAWTTDNVASATKLQTARTIWGQLFDGTTNVKGNMYDVGQITFVALSGTNGRAILYQPMADNDFFRIYVGATASNMGYAEIATADDGDEPIYVRQYSGIFDTIKRTATLLDTNGNTYFPGNVGIGTTSPFYKLHVVGNIYTTDYVISQSGWFLNNAAGTGLFNSVGDARFYYEPADGGWRADKRITAPALYSTGNVYSVGIITNSYSNDLYVTAMTSTFPNLGSGNCSNILIGKATSQYNSAYIGYVHTSDGASSNYLTLGLYSQDQVLNILANGNVGIGCTDPSYRLQVNGAIKATTFYGDLLGNADTVDGYHATTFTKGDSTHPVVIASGWLRNDGSGNWSWGGGCIRSGVTISVSRNGARLEVVANGAAVTSAHANLENSKSIYGYETSNKTGRSLGMYWLTTYCTRSTVYIKAAALGNTENDTWWSDSDMLINGTGCISTITITLFGYVY